MFPLFESIRFEEGRFYNLHLHQARVNKAFDALFPGHLPLNLESLTGDIKAVKGVFKWRISYNQDSSSISLQPYKRKPPSSLKIVINNSIQYDFKYENRTELNRLYALRSGKDDILVVRNNRITDTSYGNICLEKNGKWFTPSQPLLQGTQRDYLIRKEIVVEKDIFLDDLFTYDHFMVINAMLAFEATRSEPISQIYK